MSTIPSHTSIPPVESSPKKTARTPLVAAIAGLACVAALVLADWLFGNGSVSFSLTLDGQPLPAGVEPQVTVDGKPYSPALVFHPGAHSLAATAPNVAPFARSVWIVWGKKDLGALSLSSLKGSLKIDVMPAPAGIALRQGTRKLMDSKAPTTLNDVPVGSYVLEVTRGDYSEYKTVDIAEGKLAEVNISLNIGNLDLSATASDTEFEVAGKDRTRKGTLPKQIPDLPAGEYKLLTRHKGWEQSTVLEVKQGTTLTHRVEYPYASVTVVTEPGRFTVSQDGVTVGTAPLTLGEVRPGHHKFSASDGENELTADIEVGPKEVVRKSLVFRYGRVQLESAPSGASVLLRGKEVGKTPLTLGKVLVGDTEFDLHLTGFETTRLMVRIEANETAKANGRLFRDEYVQAMRAAQSALLAEQFPDALKLISVALETEPNDAAALKLRDAVTQAAATAAEAGRAAMASAKMQEIAALPMLNLQSIITVCTDSQVVKYPVELATGYYQDYVDPKDNKKKQRFVQTGTKTEIQTRTDYTFNWNRFNQSYRGRTFKFDCPDKWSVVRVEKDGSILLKAGGAGSEEIKVTPAASQLQTFSGVQKGQKITIKAVLANYEPGGLFTPRSFQVAEAENLKNGDRSSR
jgi:hypothetical protein